MKKTLMLKMVRQEVRRALKPTGLMGKRGPAKNVPVMVGRALDARFVVMQPKGNGGGYIGHPKDIALVQRFLEVGGSGE